MTDFKCNICGEIFTRPENASMEDDKALSISLKVHEQLHNSPTEWITDEEVNRKSRPKFQWPLKDKDYGDESLK